jgi:hypothetical protein
MYNQFQPALDTPTVNREARATGFLVKARSLGRGVQDVTIEVKDEGISYNLLRKIQTWLLLLPPHGSKSDCTESTFVYPPWIGLVDLHTGARYWECQYQSLKALIELDPFPPHIDLDGTWRLTITDSGEAETPYRVLIARFGYTTPRLARLCAERAFYALSLTDWR